MAAQVIEWQGFAHDHVSSEDLYLTNRASIDQTIALVCRRQRLSAVDADDFAGAVRLHLVQNDYAVRRNFEHRSSLRTYLITVITHLYRDWRNARWGKWRPSAEAKRQGPIAVHLERMVIRDGLSFDEAFETLRTNFQVPESKDALAATALRFPARQTRQFVSDAALENYPADVHADDLVRARDARQSAQTAARALEAAMASLAPQDRLILRMRFEDGFTIVAIAEALHLEQKPLYRRVERLLDRLRTALAESGVTAVAAAEVLSSGGFGLLPDESGNRAEFRPVVRPYGKGNDSTVQNPRTS